MAIIAISAVILIVIVIVVLFIKRSGLSDPGKSVPKLATKTPKANQIAFSERTSGPEAAPLPVPVAARMETPLYNDLRRHLAEGVEKLFNKSAPEPDMPFVAFLREYTDPKALKEAMSYLAGMDQLGFQKIRLQKIINDPDMQMTDLSKMITSDPVMTAKILKMANSSYFGITQKIDSIGHALMILGLQNVKNIIYREGLRNVFNASTQKNKTAVASLWRHSNLVSVCAQHFHDLFTGLNRGTLFTLGIVHDIGKLILMDKFHQSEKAAGFEDEYPMDILITEENHLFNINHAVIGSYALEHWNFSELMIQSVLMHHAPSFIASDQLQCSTDVMKYVLALFLSDQVAKVFTNWNEPNGHIYPLNISYHGLIDKKILAGKISDINFLNQMRAAEIISSDEYHPGS